MLCATFFYNSQIAENGVKYSLKIDNWRFSNESNCLAISIETVSSYVDENITTNSNTTDAYNLEWLTLRVKNSTLYLLKRYSIISVISRSMTSFVDAAILDGEVASIKFTYQSTANSMEIQALIPYFNVSAGLFGS